MWCDVLSGRGGLISLASEPLMWKNHFGFDTGTTTKPSWSSPEGGLQDYNEHAQAFRRQRIPQQHRVRLCVYVQDYFSRLAHSNTGNCASKQVRNRERFQGEVFGAGWRAERQHWQACKQFSHRYGPPDNTSKSCWLKVLLSDGFPFRHLLSEGKRERKKKQQKKKYKGPSTLLTISPLKCFFNYTKIRHDLGYQLWGEGVHHFFSNFSRLLRLFLFSALPFWWHLPSTDRHKHYHHSLNYIPLP